MVNRNVKLFIVVIDDKIHSYYYIKALLIGKKEQGEKVEFKMKSPKGQWPLKNECDRWTGMIGSASKLINYPKTLHHHN